MKKDPHRVNTKMHATKRQTRLTPVDITEGAWCARTPLRVSFGGGGTDFEEYFCRDGGFVLSATVNRYITTRIAPWEGEGIRIDCPDGSVVFDPETESSISVEDPLSYTKSVLLRYQRDHGLDLSMTMDLPMGAGLGSSGSMGVNLVGLLECVGGNSRSRAEVAETAFEIERNHLGRVTGRQDHYAASFGGMNKIFFREGEVEVVPLELDESSWEGLQQRILLFHTGVARDSSPIAGGQQRSMQQRDSSVLARLDRIRELGLRMAEGLESGDLDILGELMHLSWLEKRNVGSRVTTSRIDELYETATRAGALGGKICGAGGGGVMMLYCLPENQDRLRSELSAARVKEISYSFERSGIHVFSDHVEVDS